MTQPWTPEEEQWVRRKASSLWAPDLPHTWWNDEEMFGALATLDAERARREPALTVAEQKDLVDEVDRLRADLKACAEALRRVKTDIADTAWRGRDRYLYDLVCAALARRGVQEVLK